MSHDQVTPKLALPRWAELVREKYLAGEASTFVLHRNVFDVFLVGDQLVDLKTLLIDFLVDDTKPVIVEVSAEFGLQVRKGTAEVVRGNDFLASLHSLEVHLRKYAQTAVIVPYADALMPGNEDFASAQERSVGLCFHRWSLDRELASKDNITLLIVESLGSLNQALLNNPKVAAIEVPMPGCETRQAVVQHLAPALSTHQQRQYAERMAGLRCVQIESILRSGNAGALSTADREALIAELLVGTPDAAERAKHFAGITAGLTPAEIGRLIEPTKALPARDLDEDLLRLITQRKRELIEKECAGLIEFIEPKHGLAAVGGNDEIKAELAAIAASLRAGDSQLTPMGLLAVGPMGAGKTFVLKAFLKDAGFTAVALKNFRSKWVGSTERNLERVLATIKAMGPIALMIDEGDRSFGAAQGGEGGDDGTSSRVIARLKEFMSDPENRGGVLFIMLTNRPDKLDSDIKRPGRLDRKIPFFYAATGAERAAVVAAVLKRYGPAADPVALGLAELCEPLSGYSNADLEALTLLALEFRARDGAPATEDDMTRVTRLREALQRARDDFMPPQERDMITFMELLAVSETSRRSLLPAKYRSESLDSIQHQLREARARALLR